VGFLAQVRARVGSALSGGAAPVGGGGWTPISVREPYPGAWQLNEPPLTPGTALQNPTVFRCVSLIAGDIAKTPLRLVALDDHGIWTETSSPAFSPLLRKPNRYQTIGQFLEQWVLSKLLWGNAYVLKEYDARNVVIALYVLEPSTVLPLVAPDGAVYYQAGPSLLADLPSGSVGIPSAQLIHDRWNCAYHPLIGLSPLYGCYVAANQAILMDTASTNFFAVGGRPAGMLVSPLNLDQETIDRLSAKWKSLPPGGTAFFGNDFKYVNIGPTAVDAQLTEQRDGTVATIAGCFGVPLNYVDARQQPPYAQSEATQLQYRSQSLQIHMAGIEAGLEQGLALPAPFGIEFDYDALLWMDTATRTAAAREAVTAGVMAPNEARKKYFGLGPVPGGDTPYLQQQMFSLAALATRDAGDPFAPPTPAPAAAAPAPGGDA